MRRYIAIHIGFVQAGWPGLIAGGVAFIVPAFLISLALAIAYVRLGSLPQGTALFYGINPAVMAIILAATYRLGRTALRDKHTLGIGVIGLAAALAGVNEVVVLLAAGLAGILLYAKLGSFRSPPALLMAWGPLALPLLPAVAWLDDRLLRLGLFFLKVGALLFGSGMVLFAFIQRDVVSGFGWLTQQQLLDAIAVGQMTPGPFLITAAFIGYKLGGLGGGLLATFAIFAPSFAMTLVFTEVFVRLRNLQSEHRVTHTKTTRGEIP